MLAEHCLRLALDRTLDARPGPAHGQATRCSKDQGEHSIIADNVLDRQFTAAGQNQKWVADFTYIWTTESYLHVAAHFTL